MGWVKVSDDYPDHPKLDSLSDGAFRLDVSGWCYAARHLTDGVIPAGRVSRLTPRYKTTHVAELVTVGRWHPHGHGCGRCPQPDPGGYTIHDYLEFNPSAEQVNRERAAARTRMRTHRARSGEHQANERANFADRSATPSRPVDTPTSSSDLRGCDPQASDDDERLQAVWDHVAGLKLSIAKGVTNPEGWKREVARNARLELGATARELVTHYPTITTSQLAGVLAGNRSILQHLQRVS